MKGYTTLIVLASLAWASTLHAQSAPGFSIRDERPDGEKKTRFHSLLITSCNYGVRRIGDADIEPAPLEQLRIGLGEVLGARLVGKDLKVRKLTVDVNSAAELRQATAQQFTGAIPSVMEHAGTKCPREKMEAGWFAVEEVTTPNAPIIVEIQVELDGQTVAVRNVYSPPETWEPRLSKPLSRAQVNAALTSAQAKLVEALEQVLPRPAATDAAGEATKSAADDADTPSN